MSKVEKSIKNNIEKSERLHTEKRKNEDCKDLDFSKKRKEDINKSFFLTDRGKKAIVNFSQEKITCSAPLYFEDLYYFLLSALLGNSSPISSIPHSPFPNWAKLQGISKTLIIEIESLSKESLYKINSELNIKKKLFQDVFKVLSSKVSFSTELSTIHLSSSQNLESRKTTEVELNGKLLPTDENFNITQLDLMLKPEQILKLKQSISKKFVVIDKLHKKVSLKSQIFALDCEMCRTPTDSSDLTEIAIVNDRLELVYHSYVKPLDSILDYKTCHSSITSKKLENITTTLNEVQEKIESILPDDAIWCGHDIHNDLRALKMFHPFLIDTSIIFNDSENLNAKQSLKNLAKTYLKKDIQKKKSHDPIEDATTTMELVLFKLHELRRKSLLLNLCQTNIGFFEIIKSFNKKICFVGNEKTLNNYNSKIPYSNIVKISKCSNEEIKKTTMSNIDNFDFFISHFTEENDNLEDIIESVNHMCNNVPNGTFFFVIVTDHEEQLNERYCMGILKNI